MQNNNARRARQWPFVALLLVFSIIPFWRGQASSSVAPTSLSAAMDLIQAVNNLRASHGLPPYQINSILMDVAQRHSDYQASIGTWTHTGPDGSNETQRAIAAGYGGGATVKCDENVAVNDGDIQDVVYNLWQDYWHWHNMLATDYVDVGAGATVAGRLVYFTLDVCYSGSPGSSIPVTPPPGSTPPPILPAQTSTPQADGAIIHIVQPGETLGAISLLYDVPLADIYKLNGLTSKSTIYPDQKIIIRPPYTPTPTQPTATPTKRPTMTPWPTPTLDVTTTLPPLPERTLTPAPALPLSAAGGAIAAIVVTAFVIAGVMALLGKKQR